MATLINISNTIESFKSANESAIKNYEFSDSDIKKASKLNKAYRTYLNSSNKEEREMFDMMVSILDIENWKNLCDIQQINDLIELLEEAKDFDGSAVYDQNEMTGEEIFYLSYDNDQIAFNMTSTIISEIVDDDEFPEFIEEVFKNEK